MDERFIRTEMLLGKEAMIRLGNSKVLVFGVGGVGGYICEALARCGVGQIDIVDNDTVSASNINRQIIALDGTCGMLKTEAAKARLASINPNIKTYAYNMFFLPENSDSIDFSKYDYIADAVDTVTAKITIIKKANQNNIPVISSMGTGNKINPMMLEITDIYKTSVCPLARVMRGVCKKNGIVSLKVLYSKEKPMTPYEKVLGDVSSKHPPASISFVPSVAGLLIASEMVKDITGVRNE